MRTYQITVDGEIYEVTVQEVSSSPAGVVPPRAAAPAPSPAPAPAPSPKPTPKPVASAPAPAPTPASSAGGKPVVAPMPGKIMAVTVNQGDAVKSGAVLIILEAMKMENDIMAPADGTVKSVNVNIGDSVNTGDVLVVLA